MTVLGVVDLEEIIKLQKPMMNANKASRPSNLNGINDSNVPKSPKKDLTQHSTSFISLGDNQSKSPSRKVNHQIEVSLSQQLLAVQALTGGLNSTQSGPGVGGLGISYQPSISAQVMPAVNKANPSNVSPKFIAEPQFNLNPVVINVGSLSHFKVKYDPPQSRGRFPVRGPGVNEQKFFRKTFGPKDTQTNNNNNHIRVQTASSLGRATTAAQPIKNLKGNLDNSGLGGVQTDQGKKGALSLNSTAQKFYSFSNQVDSPRTGGATIMDGSVTLQATLMLGSHQYHHIQSHLNNNSNKKKPESPSLGVRQHYQQQHFAANLHLQSELKVRRVEQHTNDPNIQQTGLTQRNQMTNASEASFFKCTQLSPRKETINAPIGDFGSTPGDTNGSAYLRNMQRKYEIASSFKMPFEEGDYTVASGSNGRKKSALKARNNSAESCKRHQEGSTKERQVYRVVNHVSKKKSPTPKGGNHASSLEVNMPIAELGTPINSTTNLNHFVRAGHHFDRLSPQSKLSKKSSSPSACGKRLPLVGGTGSMILDPGASNADLSPVVILNQEIIEAGASLEDGTFSKTHQFMEGVLGNTSQTPKRKAEQSSNLSGYEQSIKIMNKMRESGSKPLLMDLGEQTQKMPDVTGTRLSISRGASGGGSVAAPGRPYIGAPTSGGSTGAIEQISKILELDHQYQQRPFRKNMNAFPKSGGDEDKIQTSKMSKMQHGRSDGFEPPMIKDGPSDNIPMISNYNNSAKLGSTNMTGFSNNHRSERMSSVRISLQSKKNKLTQHQLRPLHSSNHQNRRNNIELKILQMNLQMPPTAEKSNMMTCELDLSQHILNRFKNPTHQKNRLFSGQVENKGHGGSLSKTLNLATPQTLHSQTHLLLGQSIHQQNINNWQEINQVKLSIAGDAEINQVVIPSTMNPVNLLKYQMFKRPPSSNRRQTGFQKLSDGGFSQRSGNTVMQSGPRSRGLGIMVQSSNIQSDGGFLPEQHQPMNPPRLYTTANQNIRKSLLEPTLTSTQAKKESIQLGVNLQNSLPQNKDPMSSDTTLLLNTGDILHPTTQKSSSTINAPMSAQINRGVGLRGGHTKRSSLLFNQHLNITALESKSKQDIKGPAVYVPPLNLKIGGGFGDKIRIQM